MKSNQIRLQELARMLPVSIPKMIVFATCAKVWEAAKQMICKTCLVIMSLRNESGVRQRSCVRNIVQ